MLKQQKPLSNIQLELLKIYAAGVSDQTLAELKNIIARFLMDKARNEAESIWKERDYSTEKIERLIYGS